MKYKFPSQYSNDPQEKLHAERMSAYLNKKNLSYNPKFEKKVRALGWVPVRDRVIINKANIFKFYNKYKRLPSINGRTLTEQDLGQKMGSYYGAINHEEFTNRIDSIKLELRMHTQAQRNRVLSWCRKNNKLPSVNSYDSLEKRYAMLHRSFYNRVGGGYDDYREKIDILRGVIAVKKAKGLIPDGRTCRKEKRLKPITARLDSAIHKLIKSSAVEGYRTIPQQIIFILENHFKNKVGRTK